MKKSLLIRNLCLIISVCIFSSCLNSIDDLYDQYNENFAKSTLLEELLKQQQQEQEKLAADKRSQVGTGDRSERIRTYNFPQNRVTDHRFNVSSFDLPKLMTGDLGLILDPILKIVCEQQLEKLRQG